MGVAALVACSHQWGVLGRPVRQRQQIKLVVGLDLFPQFLHGCVFIDWSQVFDRFWKATLGAWVSEYLAAGVQSRTLAGSQVFGIDE